MALEPSSSTRSSSAGCWHRLVGDRASWPRFPEAAVALEAERRRLAVLFRAMGGDPGLELVAGSAAHCRHRLRLVQRLGMSEERLLRAERTAELVLLPPVLDCLPTAALNRDLYVWLVAFLAARRAPGDGGRPAPARPRPPARGGRAHGTRCCATFPGLRARHTAPGRGPSRAAPGTPPAAGVEAEVEALVRICTAVAGAGDGGTLALPADARGRPRGYRPFLPSPLWGEVRPESGRRGAAREDAERGSAESRDGSRAPSARAAAQARRRQAPRPADPDQQGRVSAARGRGGRRQPPRRRRGSRRGAQGGRRHGRADARAARTAGRRAASGWSSTSPTAPTAARRRLAASLSYPEWDYRRARLPSAPLRRASPARPPENGEDWAARRGRPGAISAACGAGSRRCGRGARCLRAQLDGGELDMDALVRARTDLAAGAVGSDRVYLDARNQARDLAIAILVDTLVLDRQLGRGSAGARRREGGAHRSRLRARGLWRRRCICGRRLRAVGR